MQTDKTTLYIMENAVVSMDKVKGIIGLIERRGI